VSTSDDSGRRRRRKHSDEFKAKVVAACRRPGVSVSSIALANKLNANLLRRWVVAAEQAEPTKPARALTPVSSPTVRPAPEPATFIPLQVEQPTRSAGQIQIELRRGATVVKVGWPIAAANECAAWLRELLR
jgi:transposase-like protein